MPRVIIIGAGLSGLSAAGSLSKIGNEELEVVVLEAQDHVGGRVKTVKLGNRSFDLGASRLHDADENFLYDKAMREGRRYNFDDLSTRYFVNGAPIAPAAESISEALIDELEKHSNDYINKSLKHALTEKAPETPDGKIAVQKVRSIRIGSGISWVDMPAANSSRASTRKSRNAFSIDGNKWIVDWLLSEVTAEIRLNSPVKEIHPNKVVLDSGEELECAYIICTIAVGALDPSMFHFALPPDLRKAMQEESTGTLGKVLFEFPKRFWALDFYRYTVLTMEMSEEVKPGAFPVNFTNAYNLADPEAPPTLMAFTTAPLTQFLEANPSKAYQYLLPALESLREDMLQPVPEPNEVVVTDWSQNRWFRGSYTGLKVGERTDQYVLPYVRGAGSVRFAGDHTGIDGRGMDGAIETGRREADYIAKELGL